MNWPLIITTFIGANLDFFFILLLLLTRYDKRGVTVGYVLALITLMLTSVFFGRLLTTVITEWGLGLLGLIPILMAIKPAEHQHHVERRSPIWTTFVTYVALCSADNLALFTPVLSPLNLFELGLALLVLSGVAILVVIPIDRLGTSGPVYQLMKKHGDSLTRVVYVAIGSYVFWDSGLITQMSQLV